MHIGPLELYLNNPNLVWEWYDFRFGVVHAAQPNPGHRAIADLERVLPAVSVITQNVDGLHQRAGSMEVYELHGSIRRYKCLSGQHCGFTRADFAEQGEAPPRCPVCNDLLRPDVVWFGEYLPQDVLATAYALSGDCDVMLVVGTSGVVQPAASLPFIAKRAGAFVIDVNPEPDEISHAANVFLQGKGGEVLPQLIAAVEASAQTPRGNE
jgi:NAD-dependent deacetylase